jgi:hypothetical protein
MSIIKVSIMIKTNHNKLNNIKKMNKANSETKCLKDKSGFE